MASLPTGTVTFLFTDIEGSTKLAQAHPAKWEAARQRHHVILRTAVEGQQGHVFQVIGDAFCVAFATASDALAAALAAQRALQTVAWGETPIRVRMGLHTGAAVARDGDYQGYLTLALVQRVMSTAYGGQVLLSGTSAELARGNLPAGIALRDLGEHRLRGLLNPERLSQMVAPDLPADYPPLQSLNAIPNNLPVQVTSFVGREKEIAEVKRLLATTHLLTLTGSGGTGKTRLSLQVAADVLDQFPDGVWFVELAPLADPAFVAQTVATALGVREQPGRPLMTTLAEHLHDKHLLLILDNCEHLIETCARLADTLQHAAPRLQILASSREALGIAGETAYRVPSLSLPDPKHLPALESLTQYEAVKLFIERAMQALTTFSVTNANAPAVAQICYRLDGIPLAIELAAARVRALRIEQIAARLDDRFRLLTGGSRTALPRQQTLRSAIDWSHSLLTEPERILLRRLSVFAGGWTMEAAEAVCAGEGIESGDVLDLLARLVEKSLVVADEHAAEARYRVLETIRQYAREKLLDAGEGNALRTRHLHLFVKLGAETERTLLGKDIVQGLNRMEADVDNVRAALDWAKETRQIEAGLALAAALDQFWYLRGHQAEGLHWLQDLLAQPWSGPITGTRAQAWIVAARYHSRFGSVSEVLRAAEEALAIGQQLGDQRIIAESYIGLASAANARGDYAAVLSQQGNALSIFRLLQDHYGIGRVTVVMGASALRRGEYAQAQQWLTEAAALLGELGEKNLLVYALRLWGYVLLHQGDEKTAFTQFQESLTGNWEIGDKQGVSACLTACAAAAIARKDFRLGVTLLGASDAVCESIRTQLLPYDREQHDRTLSAARVDLPDAAFAVAWAVGRALTLDQAIALALEAPHG